MTKCSITGADCLEKDCKRWEIVTGCTLRKRLGAFLYHSMDMWSLSQFVRYIEELNELPRG